MLRIVFFLLIYSLWNYNSAKAQESYIYRIQLKDKGRPTFSLEKPEEFLSGKSINRRVRQGIAIDSTDLPIDTAYINRIVETGVAVRAMSKWVKTVSVEVVDTSSLTKIRELPFVDSLCMVWEGYASGQELKLGNKEEKISILNGSFNDVNIYGRAYTQISLLNGQLLHEAGFRGENMTIAVLDGGFSNCDRIEAFDFSQVLNVKNFTHLNISPLRTDHDHGTTVLSCMLANLPGVMVGTAPEAEYYLLMTEVGNEEYPVEEDYWIAGIEYADSVGVDITNTSLGYTTFDIPEMNHTWDQLDGYSVLISRAAGMAADKGMILLNAAGNEGNKSWEKISFPADAKDIITVGSVDEEKNISRFSSIGPTADGRIKPDLLSMGTSAKIIDQTGSVVTSNGTSYSSPILTGAVACLWQALPELTAREIVAILKKSADRYVNPDTIYGYGIPDIYKAYTGKTTGIMPVKKDINHVFFVDKNRLYINLSPEEASGCFMIIYNNLGGKIMAQYQLSESIDISNLPSGVYIVHIKCGEKNVAGKFIKM